jgi:hypothetical protein
MSVESNPLIRVELHTHTRYSKDSLVKLEDLLRHCQRIGVDRVAITDHNVIEGAFATQDLAPERVIVGEEIETSQGELIGYFMLEWVPPGLEPMETIARLRAQGAVISVPHPFDTVRGPQWREAELLAIAPYVDAIEVFNARCLSQAPNLRAKSFAEEQGLLETVGSDAHTLLEIGRASLMMTSFEGPEEFKAALKDACQETKLSPAFVHLCSRFAVYYKKVRKNFD